MNVTLETRRGQPGLSMLGWVAVIVVVGSVATIAVRLMPHYIDYQTVTSIVEALPGARVHSMTRLQIQENLEKRFKINNIRNLKIKDIIRITRAKDATIIEIDYEVREHVFGNMYVVLHFSREFSYS